MGGRGRRRVAHARKPLSHLQLGRDPSPAEHTIDASSHCFPAPGGLGPGGLRGGSGCTPESQGLLRVLQTLGRQRLWGRARPTLGDISLPLNTHVSKEAARYSLLDAAAPATSAAGGAGAAATSPSSLVTSPSHPVLPPVYTPFLPDTPSSLGWSRAERPPPPWGKTARASECRREGGDEGGVARGREGGREGRRAPRCDVVGRLAGKQTEQQRPQPAGPGALSTPAETCARGHG